MVHVCILFILTNRTVVLLIRCLSSLRFLLPLHNGHYKLSLLGPFVTVVREYGRITRLAQPVATSIQWALRIISVIGLAGGHDAVEPKHAFERKPHARRYTPRGFVLGMRLPLAAAQAKTMGRRVESVLQHQTHGIAGDEGTLERRQDCDLVPVSIGLHTLTK